MNYDNVKLYSVDQYGGHAFIKIGRKYFDAQNPRGVGGWNQLTSILEMYVEPHNLKPIEQSIREFLCYWYDNGKHPIVMLENDNV